MFNSIEPSSNTIQSTPIVSYNFSLKYSKYSLRIFRIITNLLTNRENPFISPTSTQRLPHWMTQAFSQVEKNLVNEPIDISSVTSLSLPETLSLPSTPSIADQTPATTFPINFPSNLDDRYCEFLITNFPLRLDWITIAASPSLLGQHLDSSRLQNCALF